MTRHKEYDLTAVVAMDAKRGIGKDNALVWRLPEDLAHFKRVTIDKPIIMGRKTFESIGRPLPIRENIVLSRSTAFGHQGVSHAHTIDHALELVGSRPASVIGGAEIYRMMMPYLQRIIITQIHSTFDCDAFFPELDKKAWREESFTPNFFSEKAQLSYSIVTYTRKT